jgi:hypothetical protein
VRRCHLFEFADQTWCPAVFRDCMTDYLGFIIAKTAPYACVRHRLRKSISQSRAARIVDLCSGSGGPWAVGTHITEYSGGIGVCLTDQFPNLGAFEHAKRTSNGLLDYCGEPTSATDLPEKLTGFRTLFSSFHHFRPEEARSILADAVQKQQGIAVFEGTCRSPLALLLMLLVPFMVMFSTPFIRPFRWSRMIWTYLIPIVPLLALSDGLVSCLRTYTCEELKMLVSGLHQYKWEIGEEAADHGPIPITYLIGLPVTAASP